MNQTAILTQPQLNRKYQALCKQWLSNNSYTDVQINCIRGIWHLTNGVQYGLDCKGLLERCTGAQFKSMGLTMCKQIL